MPDARARRGALTLLLLLLSAGCGGDSAASASGGGGALASGNPVLPAVSTVDGVPTYTHDAAAFDRAPRLELDPTPTAVLGAPDDDPAYDLTEVSEVALLSDGRAATRSVIGARVLVFGEDGRGERVVGRMGQGPGEFVRAESLVRLAGDTLLILDTANGRMNRVHPASGAADDAPLTPDPALVYAQPLPTPLPDGRLVLHVGGPARAGEVGTRAHGPGSIALLARDGSPARTIANVRGWEYETVETRYRGRRHPDAQPVRLGRRPHVAVLDSMIATGDGDGYVVVLRSAAGRTVAAIRGEVPHRAVTAPMREAVIARELAMFEGVRRERMVDPEESRRLAREAPFADSLPPYSAILASRDGTLWVVDAIAPTDTAWSATAFRADGAIVGRLHAAVRGRPMAFEGDRVAVRQEDADGIVTVRVHRIRPARAGS